MYPGWPVAASLWRSGGSLGVVVSAHGGAVDILEARNTLGMLLAVSLPICTVIGGPFIDFWSGVQKRHFSTIFQLIAFVYQAVSCSFSYDKLAVFCSPTWTGVTPGDKNIGRGQRGDKNVCRVLKCSQIIRRVVGMDNAMIIFSTPPATVYRALVMFLLF